eukprot:TRINITY_DN13587_c0_g2_i1.p1 TRINITY_DN13587_c0_g2~~TRINITY_DN13587_c0_g2_i1.p1  ORF type:complete len:193 (+),score=40.70 TRINITY_DN13587_c0_g2_i1:77-655(+)
MGSGSESEEKKERKRDRSEEDKDRDRRRGEDRDRGPVRRDSGAGLAPRTGPYEHVGGKGKGRGYVAGPPRRALDRSKTCPFLLRVFRKIGGHHDIDDFAERGKEPVDEELQVYTWPDVTLRELSDLVKDVAPEARTPGARLSFRLVYPDKTGKNVMTDLGAVTAMRRGPDDDRPLSSSKFQTGDLVDLAIYK